MISGVCSISTWPGAQAEQSGSMDESQAWQAPAAVTPKWPATSLPPALSVVITPRRGPSRRSKAA